MRPTQHSFSGCSLAAGSLWPREEACVKPGRWWHGFRSPYALQARVGLGCATSLFGSAGKRQRLFPGHRSPCLHWSQLPSLPPRAGVAGARGAVRAFRDMAPLACRVLGRAVRRAVDPLDLRASTPQCSRLYTHEQLSSSHRTSGGACAQLLSGRFHRHVINRACPAEGVVGCLYAPRRAWLRVALFPAFLFL